MADLRMPELNKVFLAGNLTRDPELKYLPSGMAVCKLGMAVSRRFRSKDGEQKEETLFINVTAWDKTAEFCGQRLVKGKPIMVEGELRANEWEDKTTGQKRTSIEVNATKIQQLSWEERDGGGGQQQAKRPEAKSYGEPPARTYDEPVPADDIPF